MCIVIVRLNKIQAQKKPSIMLLDWLSVLVISNYNSWLQFSLYTMQIMPFQQCWWCSDDIHRHSYQLHIWWAGPTNSAGVWSQLAVVRHHCSCPVFYTVSHHCLLGTSAHQEGKVNFHTTRTMRTYCYLHLHYILIFIYGDQLLTLYNLTVIWWFTDIHVS